jgi:hypothetical protein
MKPLGSTTVGDRGKHQRGPEDLTRPTPPPDDKTGLTAEHAMAQLEDAARAEKQSAASQAGMPPGTFNHARRTGNDRCGALRGRCFGDIVNGICSKCGYDYTRTTGPAGLNAR